MNKKINGEDILLAIGELPYEYIDMKPQPRRRLPLYKKLTIAASIVLFVGIFAAVFGEWGPRFNMSPSVGKGDSFDGAGGSMDMESTSKPGASQGENRITIDINGSILGDEASDAFNFFDLTEGDEILITIPGKDERVNAACTVEYEDGTTLRVEPIYENGTDAVFTLEASKPLKATFEDENGVKLFALKIYVFGNNAELEIIKNG